MDPGDGRVSPSGRDIDSHCVGDSEVADLEQIAAEVLPWKYLEQDDCATDRHDQRGHAQPGRSTARRVEPALHRPILSRREVARTWLRLSVVGSCYQVRR